MDMSYFDRSRRGKGVRIALTGMGIAIRILLLVLIIFAIVFFARKIYDLGYEAFSAKPAASQDEGTNIAIVVTKKMTLRDIAKQMIDAGLIDESEEAFIIQANVYGYADSIVPGAHVLNTSMTVEEMLAAMSPSEEEEEEE